MIPQTGGDSRGPALQEEGEDVTVLSKLREKMRERCIRGGKPLRRPEELSASGELTQGAILPMEMSRKPLRFPRESGKLEIPSEGEVYQSCMDTQ